MVYLITNVFINNGNYNIELRNQQHEKIFIRSNDQKIDYKLGDFVEVAQSNGRNFIQGRVTKPQDYLSYFPKSKQSKSELEERLQYYIDQVENAEYRLIIDELIGSSLYFFEYPAAKSIHHAYIGGLAEHTINILELAESMVEKYDLNRDLLYTGAILHDYSKVKELESYGLTYSLEGNLVGHLVMVVEEVVKVMVKYDMENTLDIIALKHVLLSHHGKMEYGSPKEPLIREAYILSELDEIDARMNVIESALENVEDNKFSSPIMSFDKKRFLNLKLED